MTFKELQHIDNIDINNLKKRKLSIIKTLPTTDGGSEHALWSCCSNLIPGCILWKGLTGAERGMITRCANLLHKQNIPYSYYAKYLIRMGKTWQVKKSPMFITKYIPKSSGNPSILAEYLALEKYLLSVFRQDPNVILLVDKIYTTLPTAYLEGPLKYIHTVLQIVDSLKNHTNNEILQILNLSNTIYEFWDNLGNRQEHKEVKPLDLSTGISTKGSLKILQREIRIRLGKEEGTKCADLNKYFNKQNRLNKRGLEVISGERTL